VHNYGTVESTVETVQIPTKGFYVNALEKYYLYNAVTTGVHLNEFYTDAQNTVFAVLMQQFKHRQHCHHRAAQPTTYTAYTVALTSVYTKQASSAK
jgi:hypothetical protein